MCSSMSKFTHLTAPYGHVLLNCAVFFICPLLLFLDVLIHFERERERERESAVSPARFVSGRVPAGSGSVRPGHALAVVPAPLRSLLPPVVPGVHPHP